MSIDKLLSDQNSTYDLNVKIKELTISYFIEQGFEYSPELGGFYYTKGNEVIQYIPSAKPIRAYIRSEKKCQQ